MPGSLRLPHTLVVTVIVDRRASFFVCIGFLSVFTAACSPSGLTGSRPPPVLSKPGGGKQAPTPPPEATAQTRTTPPPAPSRPLLLLAASFERATLGLGGGLWVDFRNPAAAKYLLGNWRTGFEHRPTREGAVALVRGRRSARLFLPWNGAGPAVLHARMRSATSGSVRLALNGKELTIARITEGAPSVTLIEIPEGMLVRGHNVLSVRAPGTGNLEGIPGPAALAVEWLWLGPAKRAEEALRLAGRPEKGPSVRDETLYLPEGSSVHYALSVESGASLRGRVQGNLEAWVIAESPGGHRQRLPVPRSTDSLDIDLDAFAGRFVQVELRAQGGNAQVQEPAIVLPAKRPVGQAAPREKTAVRNVLVFLIDTLRTDKLQAYAPEARVRTPQLENFREHAAVFERAHTQENWTKPSVATLLSSLMPWEHTAVKGESVVPSSVELLPEMLGQHGYFTGSFIANGYVSDRFGFGQGWDTYRNYIREGRRTKAQYVASDVLAWLDARPKERPFFLYVHTIDPHVPYRPPKHFLEMYAEPDYRGPVDFRRDATLLENIKSGALKLAARDKAHLEALYDAEIAYHDAYFGQIIKALETRGLAEDTMVVVTSDHGEEFWDHGSVGHGHSVWEELLHIPMLLRIPGITDGSMRIDVPVGLVDVAPTVFESVGLPVPEHLQGQSLLGLMKGLAEHAPRSVVSGFMDGWRTLVEGCYKLIQQTPFRAQLYDLCADPKETSNIAASRPLLVAHLREILGLRLAEARGRSVPSGASRGASKKTRHRARETVIDPETEAQLRALGYVGTSH